MLGAAGYDLILVARRADRLATVAAQLRDAGAGAGVEILAADLAAADGLERVADRMRTLTVREVLDRLDECYTLLTSGNRAAECSARSS